VPGRFAAAGAGVGDKGPRPGSVRHPGAAYDLQREEGRVSLPDVFNYVNIEVWLLQPNYPCDSCILGRLVPYDPPPPAKYCRLYRLGIAGIDVRYMSARLGPDGVPHPEVPDR
jgi:hypothetical protein